MNSRGAVLVCVTGQRDCEDVYKRQGESHAEPAEDPVERRIESIYCRNGTRRPGDVYKRQEVSSEESNKGNVATYITDGNLETRWAANGGSFPQTVTIDLGREVEISQIDTLFYGTEERAYQYTISTSTDGDTFTPCIDRSENADSQWVTDVVPEGTTARYVQYRCV